MNKGVSSGVQLKVKKLAFEQKVHKLQLKQTISNRGERWTGDELEDESESVRVGTEGHGRDGRTKRSESDHRPRKGT
jgi:hypothetical protein